MPLVLPLVFACCIVLRYKTWAEPLEAEGRQDIMMLVGSGLPTFAAVSTNIVYVAYHASFLAARHCFHGRAVNMCCV